MVKTKTPRKPRVKRKLEESPGPNDDAPSAKKVKEALSARLQKKGKTCQCLPEPMLVRNLWTVVAPYKSDERIAAATSEVDSDEETRPATRDSNKAKSGTGS